MPAVAGIHRSGEGVAQSSRPLSAGLSTVRAAALAASLCRFRADFHLLRLRRGRALTALDRATWLHVSSRTALRRMGIAVVAEGAPPTAGLVVSNHLSYLDVLVYAALLPCVFVAKQEVAGWPVFGPFATMAGTIFVDRDRRAENRTASRSMEQALSTGLPVVLFPEGTSSDGAAVLPFFSPFFEPAMAAGAAVSTAAIAYRSSTAPESRLAYWGNDIFVPHLFRALAQRELEARVLFSPAARVYPDRKQAARITYAEVAALRTSLAAQQRPAPAAEPCLTVAG